ncbi:MAG TPA: LamG domain-containing protein [Polyangiaceae bacterium]
MKAVHGVVFAWGACWLVAGCAAQVVEAVEVPVETEAGRGGNAGGGSGGSAGGGAGSGGSGGQDCVGSCCAASTDDRDGDGTPDCDDACPDQPDKVAPGLCGCEIPDEDRADLASCTGLREALIHRYSFEGTGDVVTDTVTRVHPSAVAADGVLINATLTGSGWLALAGGKGMPEDDQYVALPSGIVSSLQSVTVEAWLIWYGGAEWQRIFDFGNNDSEVPGLQGDAGTSYLFLTPTTGPGWGNRARVAYKRADYPNEVLVDSVRFFPRGIETHVAVTFDQESDTLALYLDGVLEGSRTEIATATGIPMRLDVIDDVYDWLGRSQFGADAELGASLDELRVYSAALGPGQLRTSALAGPNPIFFP